MLKASCGWWKLPAAADLIVRFWYLRTARVPRDGLARGLTDLPAATHRDARTIEPKGRHRFAIPMSSAEPRSIPGDCRRPEESGRHRLPQFMAALAPRNFGRCADLSLQVDIKRTFV